MPSQQSESKDLMQKPDSSTYCPASGKKLRLKDCVAVKFTRVREGEGGMYMDPVTLETLTNASKLVVIVPTGVRGYSAAHSWGALAQSRVRLALCLVLLCRVGLCPAHIHCALLTCTWVSPGLQVML